MASILERNRKLKPAAPKKTRADYAEDALYREVWEEVNNDKTLAFVKKYSRQMAIGAIIIMIATVGIQIGVRAYKNARIAAAIEYETAIANADSYALAEVADTTSGATADLALFQAYLLDNDIEKLETLANDGKTRDFRDLARLHVVAVRGDKMSGADVEKYLKPLDTKSSPYYYLGQLTVAQKYLSENNRAAANEFLDTIINDADAPASISGTAATLR